MVLPYLLVAIKFGLDRSREVSINSPMEYVNAIIVPPFTSYKRGDSFLVMNPPFFNFSSANALIK